MAMDSGRISDMARESSRGILQRQWELTVAREKSTQPVELAFPRATLLRLLIAEQLGQCTMAV